MGTTSTSTTTARPTRTHRAPAVTHTWPIDIKSRSAATYAYAVIRLIRVRQWVKNLFLFIPSFFAGHLFRVEELITVSAGALAFSFVASGSPAL